MVFAPPELRSSHLHAVVAKTLCWDWVADMESAANRARNDDKQRLLILRPQRNMDRSCGFFC